MNMATVFEHDSFLIPSGQRRKQQFITVSSQAYSFFDVLPVLNVQIRQMTDLSISKTLKGSFNYVVFQDMPVTIDIVGIYALNQSCALNGVTTKKAIQDLYTKYKIGNPQGRALTVTVNGISYKVYAVALSQAASELAQGTMTYTLSMIGNRVG